MTVHLMISKIATHDRLLEEIVLPGGILAANGGKMAFSGDVLLRRSTTKLETIFKIMVPQTKHIIYGSGKPRDNDLDLHLAWRE